MKAILISDHAKWCALMMNGKKKVEVRSGTALYKATQKLIDEYGYAEFFVYCTKDKKNYLYYDEDFGDYITLSQDFGKLNGKVLFKFRCYKVEEISYLYRSDFTSVYTDTLDTEELEKQACLTRKEFRKYLLGNIGYAIHISDLEIFDKPKELSEFYAYCKDEKCEYRNNHCSICHREPLTKAPQSFMFIESEK